MSCVSVVFSNRALLSVCWEQPIALSIACSLWYFIWSRWDITHSFSRTLHLMMWDAQLELCLTHYLMIYLDCLYNSTYLKSFYCIRFSQVVFSFSCTFPHSFPTKLFLTPTHLILTFLPCLHPSMTPSQDIYPHNSVTNQSGIWGYFNIFGVGFCTEW